ncbi:hypothetical protein PUN28_003405 [Cardiocondyla obscurior]|uniref:MD-2-related lipid-recognition domain-containing protein n=1 Tax=Cardiocondyla obscurior TaxID=286306 RepID=A0AAW2GIS4_9HYME
MLRYLMFNIIYAYFNVIVGSELGTFRDVSVTKCQSSDEKCNLVRNTNATISFKFTPKINITQVNVAVYGVMLDVPIPFPLKNPNACEDPNDGLSCPLRENQEYSYTTTMFVQKKYPKVSLYVKWELLNEQKKNIVCIEFPVKIE